MPASAGQLFSTHSNRIEEVINNNVDVILPGLDPVWQNTVVTAQGVGPADAIGRDQEIIRVFQTGMAGVLEQANPHGDWPLFGDAGDQAFGPRLHTQSLANAFPDPTKGPNQTPYRLGCPMRAMLANIMMTLGELTAEATPAFIGQVLAPKLEGFARNIGQQLCTYFYMSQNLSYRLSGIKTGSLSAATLASGIFTWTFEPDNEAVDRYYPGMAVDILTVTTNARKNEQTVSGVDRRVPVFVSAIDELTNVVTLVSEYDPAAGSAGGAGDFDHAVADTDFIVWANSAYKDEEINGTASFTGIAGINSWLKDGSDGTLSGTPAAGMGDELKLLGSESTGDDIDVSVHPEHKSLGYNLGSVTLTEHVLRQLLRRFHAAKNKYGYYIDTLLASEGVWLGYEGTRIGREYIDRTGRLGGATPQGYTSDENFRGIQFTMDGRTYQGHTSTYVDDGVMYGIRTGGNNWKRYVPPDIRNTKPFDRNAPFIPFRFVAQALTGGGSNQLPIYQTGASQMASALGGLSVTRVTEGSQMPGWLRMQLMPEQFCGMILKNISSAKIYSDF